MKRLLIFGFLLMFAPTVFADAGDCYMGGYGMMGYWGMGWGLGMLFYLAIATFLIGAVFWLTYSLFSRDNDPKKRKSH